MPDKVEKVAAFCMNAFYQSYRPADGFVRQEHFEWLVIAADAKLKQDEYDKQVALNLRKGAKNATVVMSNDNYITENVEIEDSKINISVMMLAGASATQSIASIVPEGNCSSIIPITPAERWEVESIKNVVFWMPVCDGIEFIHLKENCNPKKAKVTYIPMLDGTSTVQDSRKFGIITMVNNYVKGAKDGVIVDMTNNANPNVSLQTEIDKAVFKALAK